ncbi:MAG: DUF551 domain-containing protein [Candidatus Peribacteraceae bacterium]|nr:DUF551 domain-containing protein [Candidatus Peribacteraceae bacterium]
MIEQFIEKWLDKIFLPKDNKHNLNVMLGQKTEFEQGLKSLIDSAVEDKWIKCSDELPKESGEYLIVHDNFVRFAGYQLGVKRFVITNRALEHNVEGTSLVPIFLSPFAPSENVTHWQPLPNPPKQE